MKCLVRGPSLDAHPACRHGLRDYILVTGHEGPGAAHLPHLPRTLIAAALLCAASTPYADDLPSLYTAPLTLIPAPVHAERKPSIFILNDGDSVAVKSGDPAAFQVAAWFAGLMADTRALKLRLPASVHGVSLLTKMGPDKQLQPPPSGPVAAVNFDLSKADAAAFGPEGYRLVVDADGVHVSAGTPAGLFYGAVTRWQLMMPYGGRGATAALPDVGIEDRPRYTWRGLLLDSAHHYQSVAEIEKLIDWMALHKLNLLHWHLTDDLGWRLEIKKYPKLTTVGGCRKAGPDAAITGSPAKPYCGFYTQAQAREVVAYAAARYITVMPEIDLPGHAQAAIAAYPEFGTIGARPSTSTDGGAHAYLYNVDDRSLGFLDDVLDEVTAVFPSTYIHVGGDAVPMDQWKASPAVQARLRELKLADVDALRGWLIARIGEHLAARGRKLIGWDGILSPDLPPQMAIMVGQNPGLTPQALRQGHDVVLACVPTLDLDGQQGDEGADTALQAIYDFKVAQVDGADRGTQMLGEELALWTGSLPTFAEDQQALFPRLAAFAENAWSPVARRDWQGFNARLPAQLARYKSLGIQYATSAHDGTAPASPMSRNSGGEDALCLPH